MSTHVLFAAAVLVVYAAYSGCNAKLVLPKPSPSAEEQLRAYANAHGLRWRIYQHSNEDGAFWCAQLETASEFPYDLATGCDKDRSASAKRAIESYENERRQQAWKYAPWTEPEKKP
jgi:hypothetical protein